MNIQCSNPVRERASQKGATLCLLAIAGYAGPGGSARPMYPLCF
jgi:hypothetical protein